MVKNTRFNTLKSMDRRAEKLYGKGDAYAAHRLIYERLATESGTDMFSTSYGGSVLLENIWKDSGKRIVFIDNKSMSGLNNASYLCEDMNIDLGGDTIAIITEKGSGVPSFYAAWLNGGEFLEHRGRALAKMGYGKIMPTDSELYHHKGRTLFIALPDTNGDFNFFKLGSKDLKRVLESGTLEYLNSDVQEGFGWGGLSEEELTQILYAARVAVGIAVQSSYYDDCLKTGFPNVKAAAAVRGNGVLDTRTFKIPRSEASEHLKGMYWRNLRHEKYYRGEHAHKPHGSRWVPVRQYWSKGEVKPQTFS